jgi:hypothetical protein
MVYVPKHETTINTYIKYAEKDGREQQLKDKKRAI